MLKDLSNISAKDGCQMDRVGDLILMDPVGVVHFVQKVNECDVMFRSLCRKWNTIARNGKSVWNKEGCVLIRLDVIIVHEQSEMHKQALFRELSAVNGIDKAYDEL